MASSSPAHNTYKHWHLHPTVKQVGSHKNPTITPHSQIDPTLRNGTTSNIQSTTLPSPSSAKTGPKADAPRRLQPTPVKLESSKDSQIRLNQLFFNWIKTELQETELEIQVFVKGEDADKAFKNGCEIMESLPSKLVTRATLGETRLGRIKDLFLLKLWVSPSNQLYSAILAMVENNKYFLDHDEFDAMSRKSFNDEPSTNIELYEKEYVADASASAPEWHIDTRYFGRGEIWGKTTTVPEDINNSGTMFVRIPRFSRSHIPNVHRTFVNDNLIALLGSIMARSSVHYLRIDGRHAETPDIERSLEILLETLTCTFLNGMTDEQMDEFCKFAKTNEWHCLAGFFFHRSPTNPFNIKYARHHKVYTP